MPNFAAAIKEEIARLARKEIKAATSVLRRSSAQHRRDLASLKRKIATLERKLAAMDRKAGGGGRAASTTPAPTTGETRMRFSAKGLASQRKRLGLSAAEYAKLMDVSAQTLYNWEQGRSRPRAAQLAKLAALRKISKREAHRRLEEQGTNGAAEE